jgi:transcriptional regulator with XRE-family HTH domain
MVSLAPDVRSKFAKRLKNIRIQRGFDRARFFAKTLGIEENRYTRYERAEVEPSLTLIQKMCETLRVTPNELLGFADVAAEHPFDAGPGLADASLAEVAQGYERERGLSAGNGPDPVGSLAWRLASEAVAIRQAHLGKKAPADPLDTFRETGTLFARLQARPFGTVAEIVRDPALKSADASRRAALAELIQSYTENVSKGTAGQRRR